MNVKLSLNTTNITTPLEAYSHQDLVPFSTVSPDGLEVTLAGNSWKKLALGSGYTITENTVLEFDFQSNSQGEIHAIGFENDDVLSGSGFNRFQLFGTQNGGRQTYRDYQAGSGWQSYQIDVGRFFTGDFDFLTLVNDHDVANPDAESQFANIRLYEPEVAVTLGETTTDADLSRYSGQDADPHFSISPDKNQVTIAGNSWKKLDLGSGYTITENTVLEFDFQSNSQGDIHAIGFDNDEILSGAGANRFQLFGTERNSRQNYRDYQAGSGWQSYQIDVGRFFTGDFDFLTLVNDHDVANPDAESQFANIRLYEPEVAVTLGETTTDADLSRYSGQDADPHFSISPDKNQVTIAGNSWKKLDLGSGYTITENTVLEFDFQSNSQGDIHAIGFDNDEILSGSAFNRFQLFGTERNSRQNYRDYQAGSGWQSYQIDVGDFFTGDFDFLTLVNDHDVANPNAESKFANIRLYEATPVDNTPPTANLSADDLTESGGNIYTFTVTYTDDTAIDVGSLDARDLQVLGPNGLDAEATLLLVDEDSDGTPRTATYQIDAPDGSWSAADNGNYTVVLRSNEVNDTNGNSAVGSTLGNFTIDIEDDSVQDIAAPTANFGGTDLTSGGGSSYTFTLTYTDDVAVDVSTLDNSDVRVTGPDGFGTTASLVNLSDNTDGTPRTATYQINAPGSTWDSSDNGTYTVKVRGNQVKDTSNKAVASGSVGSFEVDIDNANANTVAKFGMFEQSFTDAGNYSNPYADVTATATLTAPGGETQTIPLFWDGGDSWKLRYSPDLKGTWNWSINSSDSGLDGESGSFQVVASTNRGGIQADPDNPYHFEYEDGTPFYWFGDTNWRLGKTDPTENLDRAAVFDYIDTRAGQGFNYIHANFGNGTVTGNAPNEGGSLWAGSLGNEVNPGYFQELDTRIEYANSKGITVGYMLDWAQGWDDYTAGERERYAEYVTARYSGYNVVFIVSGEYDETLNDAAYKAIGNTIDATDPHDRAIAIHPSRTAEALAKEPWNSFGDYQQRYSSLHSRILGARDHNKPVVNSEYAYYLRDSNGDGQVDKDNSETLEDIRHATWDIVMAGGYIVTGWGTTYLGGKRDPGKFNVDDPRNDDWEEDVQYVREFFTDREWWELEPADNLISGSGGTKYALAEPGEQYVAYSRGSGNNRTLSLGNVSEATYRVQRFDPRTGTYTELNDYTGNGSVTLDPPDNRDWIFVLTRRGGISSQSTGSSYIGTDANDELVGDAGDNAIAGNWGSDILTGGGGADSFVYASHSDRADTITDFGSDDILQISASGFDGGLVDGVDLSEGTAADTGVLVNGSTPIGTSANFLYDDGVLSFDIDGVGSQDAVVLATLEGAPSLSASQFAIIG
ncbi:MAG: DUF4038 domain-containing protein [Cyanobacteriota bacterium]|nr:DUF4038 domain-containing protein [Cyanobacteriota bacterium]